MAPQESLQGHNDVTADMRKKVHLFVKFLRQAAYGGRTNDEREALLFPLPVGLYTNFTPTITPPKKRRKKIDLSASLERLSDKNHQTLHKKRQVTKPFFRLRPHHAAQGGASVTGT